MKRSGLYPYGLMGVAGVVAVLAVAVSCEHAKFWRGAEPWKTSFIDRMADPEAEAEELARRMAPAAPGQGEQTPEMALAKSIGCISCHGELDEPDMHAGSTLSIGCADCHGGDARVMSTLDEPGRPGEPGTPITDLAYLNRMHEAHVPPRNPVAWYSRHHAQTDRPFGEHAHADPKHLHGSRNPENTYALLNQESPEFVRFVNPGDLRVAKWACGSCHYEEVAHVPHGMMAHGSFLWGAALYNNGAYPAKITEFGESYSPFGIPQARVGVIEKIEEDGSKQVRRPTRDEMRVHGVLPRIGPLPPWNISQPGNVLRIFERGTKLPVPGGGTTNPNPAEIGNPNPLVEGGRPDKGLSPRGLGTLNRTDPVFLGLQKTRLLDPTLNFLGTNDHPGDFRSSGCTSCHTLYANDRDPAHSGPLAAKGNSGVSFSNDPTLPTESEPGHPIKHVFTNAIPSSQCITCHVHPGTSFANTYLGYLWWDNESDGGHMYPDKSMRPTSEQEWRAMRRNPDAAQLRGLWGDLYPDAESHAGDKAGKDFLARTGEPSGGDREVLNDKLEHNQFADFHGHGWVFRAVHKKDRKGNLLDQTGEVVDPEDPHKWKKAVHLKDIHLERGMHCVDCHFKTDSHGNGKLYGAPRHATEIMCIDCHGTYQEKATFLTTGNAAPDGGTNMMLQRVFGEPQFEIPRRDNARLGFNKGDRIQRSAVEKGKFWVVPQTVDTIDPDSGWSKAKADSAPESARLARYAHSIRADGKTWGTPPKDDEGVHDDDCDRPAHPLSKMACYTCHTSWMTSCFGCHLNMKANQRTPMLHNENLFTRNYTQYNFQVLRDDVFMLGLDSTVKKNRVVPVRSSSAVVVSSQNQNREWVYHQQQTVSSEGYSGQAFNPHYPHAVSGAGTTKLCSDCHLSDQNDNNAWMAQLLLQGTNFVNFFGRYVYVATGANGLTAVPVTEHDEPQAVYGSNLHSLAYPDEHKQFVEAGGSLNMDGLQENMFHHGAGLGNEILDVQLRGEYLYAARGKGGFYAYDVANIDNKGFSERIVSAPVSPLGQRLGFDTKYAVAVASPGTLAVDPARRRISDDPTKPEATIMDPLEDHHVNQEQPVHPMYAYLYVGDRHEGLVMTFAGTLLDGDPDNNFLTRAVLKDGSKAFNPDGVLDGLTSLVSAGHYLYATAAAGLVVIDIDDPLAPKVVATVDSEHLTNAQHVAIQFRYAFVTDAEGLKIIDVTDPTAPRPVPGATVPITEARRLYIARTYAFVAAGSNGLAIVDVTNPEQPQPLPTFTADGAIDDAHDVKVGMTNASLFAYVADGRNGLRVVELMGPHTTAQFRGFAPPLSPKLIATFHTHGPALAVSKGLDRDRAVDETGHQVAVFGRLGSRPMNLQEMQRLYMRDGEVWRASDEPIAETEQRSTATAESETEPEAEPADKPRRRRSRRRSN